MLNFNSARTGKILTLLLCVSMVSACAPLDSKLKPAQKDTSLKLLNVEQGSDVELTRASLGWTQEAVSHLNLAFKGAQSQLKMPGCAQVVADTAQPTSGKKSFQVQFPLPQSRFNKEKSKGCQTETENVFMVRGGSLRFLVVGSDGQLPTDVSVYSSKGQTLFLQTAVNDKDKATLNVTYSLEAVQTSMPDSYKDLSATHTAYALDLNVITNGKINFKEQVEEARTQFSLIGTVLVEKATSTVSIIQVDPTRVLEMTYSGLIIPLVKKDEVATKATERFYGATRLQFTKDLKISACGAVTGQVDASFINAEPKADAVVTLDPEAKRTFTFDDAGLSTGDATSVRTLGACQTEKDPLAMALQKVYYR